ncbi:MAG: AraC family transcriptional regulator [Chitinophagaceae bacterium]|nr:MAG: AraC family transcriptional regulator [Chitinophagaceae bacterium]
MLFEFGLRSSLLLIFFTHLCVYGFLFFKRGITQQRLPDRILGTFCMLSALFIFPWMSGFAGWYDTQPYREVLFYTPFIHALFFGPLLYLYLKSLTNAQYRLKPQDWWHFSPGAIYLLWCLAVVLTDKLILGHYYLMDGMADPDFDVWYGWTWSLSILVYLILSIQYYRNYIVFSGLEFSFADAASFKWLRNFLYSFAILTILLISEHILSLFIEMMYVRSWYYFLAFALIAYYMAISAYSARPIIKLNFQPYLLTSYTEPLQLHPGTIPITQQDHSWMEDWKLKVNKLMENEKIYLLSKVINGMYGKSFNDYVNEFRVREAIRLLQSPAHQNFNLLGIAYDAGFNSKSTFNRAFKKVTGKNPKEYIPR